METEIGAALYILHMVRANFFLMLLKFDSKNKHKARSLQLAMVCTLSRSDSQTMIDQKPSLPEVTSQKLST